ncbi:hypothetical protein [Poseidonocella sp. HB161398]|uniref:hypothetical protein n=1 Tax=Poseidonocella sp. HB161398 TaxID=2320855 RepID=UPI00110825C0|nr:hypothetical protein [Poseidonocella sp. HB161398]
MTLPFFSTPEIVSSLLPWMVLQEAGQTRRRAAASPQEQMRRRREHVRVMLDRHPESFGSDLDIQAMMLLVPDRQ